MRRYFLITIDTEGDNLWKVRDINTPVGTENAKYLYRFQSLCERYNFVVTYLTNYEMANDDIFIKMGQEAIRKGSAEIGAHEHAWNSPPITCIIKSPAHRGKPYLGEYSEHIIREKLKCLTSLLERNFECNITSHRGGRWCMNKRIARILCDLGYIADCTCTPGISWKNQSGWSIGSTGTDWSDHSNEISVLHKNKTGNVLLEVPTTIISRRKGITPSWFRPNGSNTESMLNMIDYLYNTDSDYIEFMIHSSELMPGGSPTFKNKGQIEKLYEGLEMIFEKLCEKGYTGIGLSDFARIKIGEYQ